MKLDEDPTTGNEKGGAAHVAPEDERIIAATVGTPSVLNSTIHLSPYDPDWLHRFYRFADEIVKALGERALRLEHVGSTSVPGLSAKPVIDMVLVVEDSPDEASYVPALEGVGFTLRIREPDWYEHRMLSPREGGANLHVFTTGCPEVEKMVRFRDWLRGHETDRALYDRTKRELAARTWKYVQHYADAKTAVVEEIMTRADASRVAEGSPGMPTER